MVLDNTNQREMHCHSGEGQNLLRQGLFNPVLYFIGTASPAKEPPPPFEINPGGSFSFCPIFFSQIRIYGQN
jgi:hypothetical protein